MKSRKSDIPIGVRFGKLITVSIPIRVMGSSGWTWIVNCLCDCGNSRTKIAAGNLLNGNTKSCGCSRAETRAIKGPPNVIHGMSKSREFSTWRGMLARTNKNNSIKHPDYAGRGVSTCDRWRDSFENFYADMGPRPPGKSLDRIDNNGNYEPGNCRWATAREQSENRSISIFVTIDGETKTVAEWGRIYGVRRHILDQRLKKGWSLDVTVTTPVRRWLKKAASA